MTLRATLDDAIDPVSLLSCMIKIANDYRVDRSIMAVNAFNLRFKRVASLELAAADRVAEPKG